MTWLAAMLPEVFHSHESQSCQMFILGDPALLSFIYIYIDGYIYRWISNQTPQASEVGEFCHGSQLLQNTFVLSNFGDLRGWIHYYSQR